MFKINRNKLNSDSFVPRINSSGEVLEDSYYFHNDNFFLVEKFSSRLISEIQELLAKNVLTVFFNGKHFSFVGLSEDQLASLKQEILRCPVKYITANTHFGQRFKLSVENDQIIVGVMHQK